MGMAISMAAMMTPTAAPFFVAFGHDTRRPWALATVVAVYVVVWALIGAAVGLLMDQVMLPSSTLAGITAVALAGLYLLMPWSRRARERCREMCRLRARGSVLQEAAAYANACVVCSAGVMAALLVLGMANVMLVAVAAGVMLAYKLI